MSFKEITIKSEYRTLTDNVVEDFYVPLLREAILYNRAVGFFSSSALVEISHGISGLIKNGGRIRIIASPLLSEDDYEAIKKGYADREDVYKAAVLRELREPSNKSQEERLNYLANLIADGYLDIRIAVTNSNSNIGMYHEKMGILADAYGNRVAFSGSMNESANALFTNYEAIDVFTSWSSDERRVENKEAYFDAIWSNCENGIQTLEFSELKNEIIDKYKHTDINYSEYNPDAEITREENEDLFFRIPQNVSLYEYQNTAISNWVNANFCGYFDMATGSGKTYTALGALCRLSQLLKNEISVVIVVPYQHLVEQWVEDIQAFSVQPIVAYSYPGQSWRTEFRTAVNSYNIGGIKNFCIITTNATFASDDFQRILGRYKKNYCFVVDEAHNFGAKKLSKLLPKKARYRLALSATFERYRDEEGTDALKAYFGKTPCIVFTLKDAISNGFLTPYYYYPILTYLDDNELEEYVEITEKIIRLGGASDENRERNSQVELLLIKRARIVAGCRAKIDNLIETIKPFKDEYFSLVYCGATRYDHDEIDDVTQIKQIDEVNYRLYHDLGMKVRKFTSTENKTERDEIKKLFSTGENLQVITAIKCLDEGVNIPSIKRAFILASSTNPREYVQRRGRVLRKFPGKNHAEIYDFITLPRSLDDVKYCSMKELGYDLTLVRKEFERMMEFANNAQNPFEIDSLKNQIEKIYSIKTQGGSLDE